MRGLQGSRMPPLLCALRTYRRSTAGARGARNGAAENDGMQGPERALQSGTQYEVAGVVGSQPVGIGPAQPSASYISTRDALDLSRSEAVLLSVLGGATGVGLGVASSALLPALLADLPPAAFGPGQVALAFGISALVGVHFGSLPAYHSARL